MMYARDFRASARAALKGKWGMAMLAGIIALILGAQTFAYSNGLSGASGATGARDGYTDSYVDPDVYYYYGDSDYGYSDYDSMMDVFLEVLPLAGMVLTVVGAFLIIKLIIGCAVTIGYARYHLALMDGMTPGLGELFSGFSMWSKAFLLQFLQGIYLLGWTMLFVIPGIIKTYSYAMSPYILAENPDMSPNEAITASRALMDGNKWRLFCLEFSFIGWGILASLTCGLGSVPLEPYMASARAAFYREISQTWRGNVVYDTDLVK